MKQSQASLVNHLASWVRSEIEYQRQLDQLLQQQMDAVVGETPEEVEVRTLALDEALRLAPARYEQRARILGGFESLWGVPASAMTLRSIAERVGESAAELLNLREQLRDQTAHVMKQGRKAQALFNLHRSLFRDVIETLLADENGSPFDQEGALVDARA